MPQNHWLSTHRESQTCYIRDKYYHVPYIPNKKYYLITFILYCYNKTILPTMLLLCASYYVHKTTERLDNIKKLIKAQKRYLSV